MRIVGEFLLCADGETRPVAEGQVADGSGGDRRERFLVDTGADLTVFTANFLAALGLPSSPPPPGTSLGGVGGKQAFVVVHTTLTLYAEDGSPARFQGQLAAFTDPAAGDMSVLGRDVLDHFDLIISRRRNEVLLLATNHDSRIERK
jgi:hypothetical protein